VDFDLMTVIDPVNTFLWSKALIYVLLGAGLFFTIATRGVQLRMFPQMFRAVGRSGDGGDGISSFQAFAVGLASRVGTGNIVGVAIALTLGGPGAIFWMWVVALLGMATAFIEATLAQMYKVKHPDGTFRGGPAYYIQRGLGSKTWGAIFAALLVFTFGIAFNMVQANTIAGVMQSTFNITPGWTAVGLVLLTAPILFGGVRRIAKAAGAILPFMAGAYILLAIAMVALHIDKVVPVLNLIVDSAFGFGAVAGGLTGGLFAALMNGVKRGLFSNEAGMGSAPNAAATATTKHPVNQGLIQSLGVFVDTILICTATAFIILVNNVYVAGETTVAAGATLTQDSVAATFGSGSSYLMAFLIFVFAYTSVLGNYSYSEVNLNFLGSNGKSMYLFRGIAVVAVVIGATIPLTTVWALADVAMGLMALVNITAIVLLAPLATAALKDYKRQLKVTKEPVFKADEAELPRELVTEVW
jgi:AGCS family alanine or glycine:cation symporter